MTYRNDQQTIHYETIEDFYKGIECLHASGLNFRAWHDSLTIILT